MDTRVTIIGDLGDRLEKFKESKYPHLTSKGFFIEMARLQMEKGSEISYAVPKSCDNCGVMATSTCESCNKQIFSNWYPRG